MSTTSKTWDKKAIYHSELVKASQGGLVVQFNGKPRDSKYPGKPAFVGFKVMGDEGGDYTLNIENDDIRKVLDGVPERTWVMVKADGTREHAWVTVEDANGNYVNDKVPAGEIVQPQTQPPPLWNDQPKQAAPVQVRNMSKSADTVVDRAAAMTIHAVGLLEEAGIRVDSDAAARIYNTHYIQASR